MVDNSQDDIDWSATSEEMARQIFQQGETYLNAQFASALASDQRATTIAGFFAAIASAILAAALAYWDKTADLPILLAGLSGATCMTIGSLFSLWSARPINFYYPGNHPKSWFVGRFNKLNVMLGYEAQNYQSHIEKNDKVLGENTQALWKGALIAVFAPIVAIVVWLLASAICSSSPAVTAQAASLSQLSSGVTSQISPSQSDH